MFVFVLCLVSNIACVSGLSILYCLFLWIVYFILSVSLDCLFYFACVSGLSILYYLFLWIVHSVLSVSLDCPFNVPVSGLSILFCLCPRIFHYILLIFEDCWPSLFRDSCVNVIFIYNSCQTIPISTHSTSALYSSLSTFSPK